MWAALTTVVLAACGTAAPCTNCPPVNGTYAVTWLDGGTTSTGADGGALSCSGPRDATWVFTQRGTNVITTINDVALGGTLYDTYDLLLSGTSTGVTYRLRTLVIPQGTSLDAGMRLQGTFTTRTLTATQEQCESNDPFTATRQ